MLTKLTKADSRSTYRDILWEVGKTVSIPEANRCKELCSPGLLHVYEGGPELAMMLDPIHADIGSAARCFEVQGDIVNREGPVKAGGHSFYVIRELPIPEITTEAKVTFAILCAKEVCQDKDWLKWADNWLSGTDRTEGAAARSAARSAAAWAAEAASEAASEAAARAAEAAAWAAEAEAAAWAAAAAAWAAEAAAEIDLNELALKACKGVR